MSCRRGHADRPRRPAARARRADRALGSTMKKTDSTPSSSPSPGEGLSATETIRPPGTTTTGERSKRCPPTVSNTTSTGSISVNSRVWWSITSSAPSWAAARGSLAIDPPANPARLGSAPRRGPRPRPLGAGRWSLHLLDDQTVNSTRCDEADRRHLRPSQVVGLHAAILVGLARIPEPGSDGLVGNRHRAVDTTMPNSAPVRYP